MNDTLRNGFLQQHLQAPYKLTTLAGGGSDRTYFRVELPGHSYILTQSDNIQENDCFLYMSELLVDLNVPEIIAVSDDRSMYLQTDLGDTSLLEYKQKNGKLSVQVYAKVVSSLWDFQKLANQRIDYSRCFEFERFTPTLVLRDMFYFKHYFLDLLSFDIGQSDLLNDFEHLSSMFTKSQPLGFCYRDFQGRNVMIKEEQPIFIDYQGGMNGPVIYDLVSLTWQAKAQLSNELKSQLKNQYFDLIQADIELSREELELSYNYCLLERLLQVLGAYGKLGILQKKPHFIDSIAYGIANLKHIKSKPFLDEFPALKQVIQHLCLPTTLKEIEQKIHA